MAAVLVAACGGVSVDVTNVPDLRPMSVEQYEARLTEHDQPAIVNVWASWCIPCRSEAPLLAAAHERYGADVEFIGVDVQDNQAHARRFIAEFGLEFEQVFDRARSIPSRYGGFGVPITSSSLPTAS